MCVDGKKWKSIRGEKIETFKVPEGSGSWSWRLLWVELSSSSRTATNGLFSWSVPFWDVYFVIETRELDLDWKLFQLLAACSPWGGVYWIQFNAALSTFCMNDAAFSGSSFCVSWWTQWCCFHFYLFSFMSGFFASFHQTPDLPWSGKGHPCRSYTSVSFSSFADGAAELCLRSHHQRVGLAALALCPF